MQRLFTKILLSGSLLFNINLQSQDISFSQFYEQPMLRNPSLAGIFTGDVRITAAYRNQWQAVTVPYRTMAVGIEIKKTAGKNSNDFMTLGLQATNDMAGDSKLSRVQAFPVINYHKSLDAEGDTYLSAAMMGGPVFQKFDPGKLSFDDQFVNGAYSASNPTRQAFGNNNLTYLDAAAGLSFSSKAGDNCKYYFGAGLFHITQPKVAFQKQYDVLLNRKWALNAGLSVQVDEQDKVIGYADYFIQGQSRQAQGGVLISHDLYELEDDKISIAAGLFYRLNDAVIPVVKIDYYQLGIGITYDVNASKLKTASVYRGGFELTLSYKAWRNIHNTDANEVRCPGLF